MRRRTGKKIADVSTLSDIRNTEGDEEFTKDADGVLWWENKGEDIQYKGAAQAALPVQVHIQYFLDEKEIAPEELAGKSGHLRMRFTYDNQEKRTVTVDGKQREVCVPFAAMSTCLLPADVFSHVEVTNGKLISMGDQNLAVGDGVPGTGGEPEACRLRTHGGCGSTGLRGDQRGCEGL